MGMVSFDPRWDYIWTHEHEFFYCLLKETQDGAVEWFSNVGGVMIPKMSPKYATMFGGKLVEIDYQVTSVFDPVFDRLLADLKRALQDKASVTELSYTDYKEKVKEFKSSQAGLL